MRLVYEPEKNKEQEEIEKPVLSGGTVMEETLDQHAKMKGKPFREQLSYYFGYYKFHALGLIVVVGIVVSIIVTIASHKDFGFCAMIVNSANIDSEIMSEEFASYAGINTEEYECYITANETELPSASSTSDISASTKFAAYISSGDMDIAMFDSDMFYRKAINGCFADLREILSEEDLEKYKDRFFYIDQVEYDKIQNSSDPTEYLFEDIEIGEYSEQEQRLKPYMDPSSMEDPIPVGIVVEDAVGIKAMNCYTSMIPVLGIPANTSRPQLAISFLHFLYDESVDFRSFQMFDLNQE